MVKKKRNKLAMILERFSFKATQATGTSTAFILALSVIVVWGITGPIFGFSDTWQLVINTGTTIVTFLMVFLIQRTQNKDAQAIHLKLNEIVAALEGASNRLIDVESLTEDEIQTLHEYFKRLASMAKKDIDITQSHSIEEADTRHQTKHAKHRHPEKKG
jgi:low affinity Fe/Cu permease